MTLPRVRRDLLMLAPGVGGWVGGVGWGGGSRDRDKDKVQDGSKDMGGIK